MTSHAIVNRGIHALSRWVDSSYPDDLGPEAADWRRITKVVSEAAEAQDAFAGMIGENPRKGVTHTRADVAYELLDTAVAALGAYLHLYDNDPDVDLVNDLAEHVDRVVIRAEKAGLRL